MFFTRNVWKRLNNFRWIHLISVPSVGLLTTKKIYNRDCLWGEVNVQRNSCLSMQLFNSF
jgi:hypothetical protein